jgi:3-oxoacyl-[acyl-carrier-protein] synthase-3
MPTVIESVATAAGGRWRRRSAHTLADAAARRAIEAAGLAASDVDLLINTGLYHDRNLGEPALAALIQEDIGANPEDPHPGGHGTFSFDVANGSCGMLTGLQIADGFLRAGTVGSALVVASDARPGRRLAPDFPFGATGAAITCRWRPDGHGIRAFRFAGPPDGEAVGELGGGLRATVGFAGGRNRLAIAAEARYAAAAGAWAGEVAGKLLADHGLHAGDLDAVVANPLVPDFLDAVAARLGVDRRRVVDAPGGARAHTAGLGVALAAAAPGARLEGTTALLVSAGAGPAAGAALLR